MECVNGGHILYNVRRFVVPDPELFNITYHPSYNNGIGKLEVNMFRNYEYQFDLVSPNVLARNWNDPNGLFLQNIEIFEKFTEKFENITLIPENVTKPELPPKPELQPKWTIPRKTWCGAV